MTVNIQLATVAASIAALNVSGVTICDIDEIPLEGSARGPLIIPIPERYVTNLSGEDVSFGAGAALKDLRYTLNYRLLYAPIGSAQRAVIGGYAEMIAVAVNFMEAIMAISTLAGAVEIQLENVPAFGPVLDPVGTYYHGCDFALRIHEFIQ